MIDFLKRISLHNNKEKCLVCRKSAGKDAAVVNFKYQGGTGQAFVCKKCADELDKTKMDDIDESL
jgi:hypothetical protein